MRTTMLPLATTILPAFSLRVCVDLARFLFFLSSLPTRRSSAEGSRPPSAELSHPSWPLPPLATMYTGICSNSVHSVFPIFEVRAFPEFQTFLISRTDIASGRQNQGLFICSREKEKEKKDFFFFEKFQGVCGGSVTTSHFKSCDLGLLAASPHHGAC